MPARAMMKSLGAALVLLASVATGSADPFRLILTHLEPPLLPNSVMDLAKELGYFEREGVDVELVRVQQTPSAIAALQAGEGEMANIAVDALLQLVAQGMGDFKAVTSPNKSLPFLIATKDDIKSIEDLKGRSFGVGRVGSLDHSLSMKVLASAGLDTETLEILGLGQPNVRAQALAAGQVDATTMSIGVWLSIPDKNGLSVLVNQDDYYKAAPVVNKVNVVSADVLERRGDEVAKVVRALIAISRDFQADPSKWAAAMEKVAPNVTPGTLDELARSFDGTWSVNGGMSASELQYTQDWIYQTADFAGVPPVEMASWVDFSVVDGILKDMGTDPAGDAPAR